MRSARRRFLGIVTRTSTLAVALAAGSVARAQDSTPAAGEPITSIDPTTLTYDYLVDGNLAADDPSNRKFATLQAAYAAAPEGTADQPTVIGIAPNVYLMPGAMSGASLNITKNYITLLGLTNNRRSVVLADNRGNQMGASDNGYVIIVNATGFTAKNLTILNYCNVDYSYPGDPTKNLTSRSAVITQAVALQASGDKHVYQNVALLSRLDTMFLQTTRSYFKSVYIEGTDDFIISGTVSAWEDAEIFFPTGSGVSSATNIAFINSKFTASSGLQFDKGPGPGVALINCSMPAPPAVLAWLRGDAPPRPNQYYVTYNVKDTAGNPATIVDGTTGGVTFDYSWELSDQQALAFNPWNLLRATPTGVADDWDPANARDMYESAGQGSVVFRVTLSGTPASVRSGGPGATIGATVAPIRVADPSITWSTPSSEITLSTTTGPSVVVTGNLDSTGMPDYVPVIATAANGFHATAWVYVEPPYEAPPILTQGPTLTGPTAGQMTVDYAYDLGAHTDQSIITWSICADATCATARDVATSRDGLPLTSYALTEGDVGQFIRVGVQPKHDVSDPGPAVFATSDKPIAACDVASTTVSPNFRDFVTTADSSYVSGLWTVIGTWTVQAGATLVNGYGVRVGSQGAALLYQDDTKRGDMQVAVTMTPEKTSGAAFGSPGSPSDGPTVQKSDIFIKYDPRTQTGYSLRYWRTTQSASACLFQLYRIDNGAGTPLNDTQVLTGVFRDDTELIMKVTGDQLTVDAHNTSNAETLSLAGTIAPNDFGGAGVAWGGTVSRGNSNVYSKLEISYPGATVPACETPPPQPPTTPPPVKSSSGCGCASAGPPGGRLLAALLLVVGLLMARSRRVR
jgi:MYXO-CTERM domain-containing protein